MSDKVPNRNRAVLNAAVLAAESHGFRTFTRQQVADGAGVATGSVNNAFGTMEGLRDAVMAAAVDRGIVAIIAQGLAVRHPAAVGAPDELKQQALAQLAA